MGLILETCAASHLGDRKDQQDRVALFPHPTRRGMLMAVLADGMGGHSGGAMAAEQVLHKARQNFEHWGPADETPRDLLAEVVNDAHLVIKLTSVTSEQDPHSTAVILLLQGGRADWVHVGDSRLYHFRKGILQARTEDHSLVAEMVRKGVIDQAAALVHPRRNLLLHCLGAERPPHMDLGASAPLQDGDAFVLCSDGLWAYFRDEEMGQIVHTQPARRAAALLIERARERAHGGGDNLSVAIVKVSEAPAASAAGGEPETTSQLPPLSMA